MQLAGKKLRGRRKENRKPYLPTPSGETGKLMPLKTIEPRGINAIGDEERMDIDVAVDSGAPEHWSLSKIGRDQCYSLVS